MDAPPHRRPRVGAAKRLVDVLLSVGALAALAPVLAVAALAIKLDDGGPVFFRQERVGQQGRPFRIWKFRSMRAGPRDGARLVTVAGDPRITRSGRWLRRSKLDEVPQLLNVLAGEMTLVGPRPEVGRYVARYTGAQAQVLALRPGITDPASIAFIDEEERLAAAADPERTYVETIMPAKIAINLAYAERANLWRDAMVIARTVGRVVARSTTR